MENPKSGNRVASPRLVHIPEMVTYDSSTLLCKIRISSMTCFVVLFPPHQSLLIISIRWLYPFFFLEVEHFVIFNILISFWIISWLGGQKTSIRICWLVGFSGQHF